MTMRRILCVLVLCVLVTGCSYLGLNSDTPKTASPPIATNNRTKIDFSKADGKVREALKKMKPVAGTAEPNIKQVKTDVQAALEELDIADERADACVCPAAIGEAKAAQGLLQAVSTSIGAKSERISEVDEELREKLQSNLESAATKLKEASRLAAIDPSPSPTASASVTTSSSAGKTDQDSDSTFDLILFAAKIAGGLLILTIMVFGFLHLRNQSQQHLEHRLGKATATQASVTREAQKDILDKLSSLSSAQSDTNSRLHDVHTEIRTLARLVRESSVSRGDGRSYASLAASYSYNDPAPPKEEPEFPVSAFDYLDKMTRYSNVVKPDFQNGILINDPDGTGELMLIRDSRVPDETQPLFVVPRHAQFQTKQDFYTYYEKYYDCVRPGAGDVWIIDPAVVEKVSGGWQLREKGVLEIR